MIKLFWKLRIVAKRIYMALKLGMLIEYCGTCGVSVPIVWHADDALWKQVSEFQHGNGVLCPLCFDRAAQKKGILLMWKPENERWLNAN